MTLGNTHSPDAFERIKTVFSDPGQFRALTRFARSVVGPDEDRIANVVADTYVRAVERADQLDPARDICPWLFQIAKNIGIDSRRALGRRPEGNLAQASDGEADESDRLLLRSEAHRAHVGRVENHEVAYACKDLVDRLRKQYPEMVKTVEQKELLGMTWEEVASLYQVPVGRIKMQIYRWRRRVEAHQPDLHAEIQNVCSANSARR